jgi:hypothetical protein
MGTAQTERPITTVDGSNIAFWQKGYALKQSNSIILAFGDHHPKIGAFCSPNRTFPALAEKELNS